MFKGSAKYVFHGVHGFRFMSNVKRGCLTYLVNDIKIINPKRWFDRVVPLLFGLRK